MTVRAILLRVILSVALVFNGAASAMASVEMAQMHAQTGVAHQHAQAGVAHQHGQAGVAHQHEQSMPMTPMSDAAPCHDEQPKVHADEAHAGSPTKAEHPDCCTSTSCTCACVSHVVAVVPVPALAGVATPNADLLLPVLINHVAPPLPHLIRPPIG